MAIEIQKVGVIGAGQMGNGIAQVCALAGLDVLINDVSQDRLHAGLATVDGAMARDVAKGLLSDADRKAAMARITTTTSFEDLVDCDLVMEAASENEEVKRKIFTRLSPYLKAGALIATNTSSISITRLASVTDRPERFIGIHFMNPVPRMQLVELIRGIS
jgi:3-hydroxybutyryl-CoA dehydrogenase